MGRENWRRIYELVADEPSLGLQGLFVTSTATSSLWWHRHLGHPCFDKLKKTLPWLSLTQFVCESCQLDKHHQSSYSSRDGIPLLHLLIFFIVMFGIPLVILPSQVIATISWLLMTILV